MKHLKLFESFENEIRKYNKGDYVLVTSQYLGIEMEPCKIDYFDDNDVSYDVYKFIIGVHSLKNKNFGGEIVEDEIIRKLEDHEIAAIKYNL
jgi:hypothetical protein